MIGLESSLSKLSIESFRDAKMSDSQGRIEAMYNPTSIDLSYAVAYGSDKSVNTPEARTKFREIKPGNLRLELIFDSKLPGNKKVSVDDELMALRRLTTVISAAGAKDGGLEFHGTPYLKVKWGKMQWHEHGYFAGRLQSMAVRYELFGRDGTPRRAVATLELIAQTNLALKDAKAALSPPKVSAISVPDLTSLAALAAVAGLMVAGTVVDYLQLASDNEMDNFDDFEAGDVVVAQSQNEVS